MLGGELAVLQAPIFDRLLLDPFTLLDDGCSSAEVGVGERHAVQAIVVVLVVVVLNEGLDLGLDVLRQFSTDVTGPVIAAQLWNLQQRRAVAAGCG